MEHESFHAMSDQTPLIKIELRITKLPPRVYCTCTWSLWKRNHISFRPGRPAPSGSLLEDWRELPGIPHFHRQVAVNVIRTRATPPLGSGWGYVLFPRRLKHPKLQERQKTTIIQESTEFGVRFFLRARRLGWNSASPERGTRLHPPNWKT